MKEKIGPARAMAPIKPALSADTDPLHRMRNAPRSIGTCSRATGLSLWMRRPCFSDSQCPIASSKTFGETERESPKADG